MSWVSPLSGEMDNIAFHQIIIRYFKTVSTLKVVIPKVLKIYECSLVGMLLYGVCSMKLASSFKTKEFIH